MVSRDRLDPTGPPGQRVGPRLAQGLFVLAGAVVQCGALLAARAAAEHVRVVPRLFRQFTDLGRHDTAVLMLVFVAAQVAAAALARWSQRAPAWRDTRRIAVEVAFALSAASAAGCVAYVLTQAPFSANFYALVDLATVAGWTALCLLARRLARGRSDAPDTPPPRPVSGLLRSPAVVLFAIVVASPGLLALAYKKDRDFADALNRLRSRIHMEPSPQWELRPAFDASFEQPMQLAFGPGDDRRFWLLSRTGRLSRHRLSEPGDGELMLDLWSEVGSVDSELGGLSFALHPGFGADGEGRVFVWYSHSGADGLRVRLASFDLRGSTEPVRRASRRLLIDQARKGGGAHNGGTLLFDREGFLLVSIGDLGDRSNGQRVDRTLAAGILRIDVDQIGGEVSAPIRRQPESGATEGYFIPRSNPWFDTPGALQEYWAIGLRNPFRMALDEATNELWVGDVGSVFWEEHNVVRAGDNGGWPFREGERQLGPVPEPLLGAEIAPRYAYHQTALLRAALGGVVYRGERYPELRRRYLFADNNASSVHSMEPVPDPTGPAPQLLAVGSTYGQMGITSLLVSPSGRILVTSLGSKERIDGRILELAPRNGGEAQATPPRPESPEQIAESTWARSCAGCHGLDGRGVGETEPAPPDFTSVEWQAGTTDDRILEVITRGGQSAGLSPTMPAWQGLLDDEQIALLAGHVRRFGVATGGE